MDSATLEIGLVTVVVIYLVYKVLRFATADADLNLLSHSLKPHFFKGKVIWVTGSSSGIGEELCRQLSKLGAKLILSARSEEKLKSVLQSLAHPEESRVLVLDLADRESVNNATDKAKGLFGRINILVNNGGIASRTNFMNFVDDAARQIIEINFLGTVSLTRDVLQVMLQQKEGCIVNISSIAGICSGPTRHYYAASKSGLNILMDSLRLELHGNNIHFINVCPGPVKTNVAINALTSDGTKFGKTDAMIGNGMKVQRCVELTLIATSNKIREVWICHQPFLVFAYLAQYMPSLYYFLIRRNVEKTKGKRSKRIHD